ncbi:hypothetical protein BDW59DRAFT_163119 [Aspergillus cavernicola]|uniref:Uncharacterized protein n=1 Tax=Aspergillus cavernicola TaxID=176166 RepID=A0ABR4I7D8_9EURO
MSTQHQFDSPLNLNLDILPWSRRGAFMSLGTKAKVVADLVPCNDVYLLSQCRAPAMPLFAIRPLPEDAPLGPSGFHTTPSLTTFSATPSLLQWQLQDRIVAEATFQDLRCIRFRVNVPVAFDSDITVDADDYMGPYIFTRPPFEGSMAVVELCFNTFKGYRFMAIQGKLTTVNGDMNDRMVNRRVQIQGDEGHEEWELLFCEIEVGHSPSSKAIDSCEPLVLEAQSISFDSAACSMAKEFDDFAMGLCP